MIQLSSKNPTTDHMNSLGGISYRQNNTLHTKYLVFCYLYFIFNFVFISCRNNENSVYSVQNMAYTFPVVEFVSLFLRWFYLKDEDKSGNENWPLLTY